MTKLEKIKEIKNDFHKNFKKLDTIVKTTNLGEELNVLLKIYNLKEYFKRKIQEIESEIARI